MNATVVLTIATATPPATTPREDSTALVMKDSLEMDRIAQVCFMFVCVACFTCTSIFDAFSLSAKLLWLGGGRGEGQQGSYSRYVANEAKQLRSTNYNEHGEKY